MGNGMHEGRAQGLACAEVLTAPGLLCGQNRKDKAGQGDRRWMLTRGERGRDTQNRTAKHQQHREGWRDGDQEGTGSATEGESARQERKPDRDREPGLQGAGDGRPGDSGWRGRMNWGVMGNEGQGGADYA